jgi:hypothetical protein
MSQAVGSGSGPGTSGNYRHYEDSVKQLEEAYKQLSTIERFRANSGVIYGFVVAIVLSNALNVAGIPSIWGLATLDFDLIGRAFAQSSSVSASAGLPTPLVYIVNIALLVLMLGCFYAAIVLKDTTMIVRDTSKTLLGYFVGRLLK